MAYAGFPPDTVPFLADLRDNNDSAWFKANKKRYEAAVAQPAKDFVAALGECLPPDVHCEPRVNGSIFRINRDTRFSKDKTPYKDHLDMMFWKGAGRSRECPGLFMRLTPEALHLGGGLHSFAPDVLARYRTLVAGPQGAALEAVLDTVGSSGFTVGGDLYKRVPKGFDADHPRAELLKHKGLHAFVETDVPSTLTDPSIVDEIASRLVLALPLVDWLLQATEPSKT